jgi:dihydrodiol dehydrogenase / D-xylose 1-dehydrogenase (NADP)
MWTKFLPITHAVKKWIKEKRIGEVKYLKIAFGFYNKFDINNRLFNPTVGGGALLDVGVYPITYAVDLMEALPEQIVSSAHLGNSHVDEQNVIILRFKEGALADLSSGIAADLGKDAVIVGDLGKIVVPSFWRAENAKLYDAEENLSEEIHIPFTSNGFEYELEEVNRCLRDGKKESDRNALQDTFNIIKIMDEIRSQWGLVYPNEQQ